MGKRIEKKLFVLIGLFLVTCILMSMTKKEVMIKEKPPLKNYFEHINGYETVRHIELLNDHYKMLDLDDYLFVNYKGNNRKINLYIGYYYTANKAYAAHSPLICYPSQGWEIIVQPTKHSIDIGPHTLNYEEIITGLGNEKELVLYWWQAYQQTNTQIYKNKIDMGYNKFIHNNEEHAFVRVSVNLANSSFQKSEKAAIDFIKVFYPQFIDFITE